LGQQSRLAIARRRREKGETDSEAPVKQGEETGAEKGFGCRGWRDEAGRENERRNRCRSWFVLEDTFV